MERCGSTTSLTLMRAPWKGVIYHSCPIWLPIPISSFSKDDITVMNQVRGLISQKFHLTK